MITVVGEILVDLIEETPGNPVAYPGGSPANVAVALARLGRSTSLLTQLAADPYGRLLLDHLRTNGVRVARGSRLDAARTSAAHTSLAADGQASYTFDINWSRLPATGSSRLDPDVTCVHTGSLATVLPPGADDVLALVRAARATAMVSYDPNCRPSLTPDRDRTRERVTTMVASSDVVKVSLDDVTWLYPGRHYRDVGREWLGLGAGLVAVTLGGDGAWACTRGSEATVDACPVDVADTIGAGDAFTAGLLSALAEVHLLGVEHRDGLPAIGTDTLTSVLSFASWIAALTCGRRGADPPSLAELAAAPARPASAAALLPAPERG